MISTSTIDPEPRRAPPPPRRGHGATLPAAGRLLACLTVALLWAEVRCLALAQTTTTTYLYNADGAPTAVTTQVDGQAATTVYLTWDNFVPGTASPATGTRAHRQRQSSWFWTDAGHRVHGAARLRPAQPADQHRRGGGAERGVCVLSCQPDGLVDLGER